MRFPSTHPVGPCSYCRSITALGPVIRGIDARRHRWDLPLMSADAKQYFLPAWLIASMSDEEFYSDFASAVLFCLASDHRMNPTGGYTDDQANVFRQLARLHVA